VDTPFSETEPTGGDNNPVIVPPVDTSSGGGSSPVVIIALIGAIILGIVLAIKVNPILGIVIVLIAIGIFIWYKRQ
jgi:hypothetical protein